MAQGRVYTRPGTGVLWFEFTYGGSRIRQTARTRWDYAGALRRCRHLLEQLRSARLRQAQPRWLLGTAFDLRAA
jgi:hypothetical protein